MNNKITEVALGLPLPDSPHAVSVSLPKWDDVKGYEEGEARVINAMKLGYPRFVYHPLIKQLFAKASKRFAKADEFSITLPSERIAQLGKEFIGKGRIDEFSKGIYALTLPNGLEDKAKQFWMHAGYIVSSRKAEATLNGSVVDKAAGEASQKNIKVQIAELSGELAENIYLYPSGMSAIFAAFEIVAKDKGKSTVQLGFPYVDTFKIQQKFGKNSIFFDYKTEADIARLKQLVEVEKPAAIFTEFPCNPLITCIDLKAVSDICRENNILLVVDDTLSTWVNVDLRPYADIIVTSLTKFYSGVGDVIAGSLILNSSAPQFKKLKKSLDNIFEDLLFADDAVVLENNSKDFQTRIDTINKNAEALYDCLKTKPHISQIFYTKDNETYHRYKKNGYGGIISLVLENEDKAQKFFDALELKKGPSLGTNYTLACPYTMLAHYHEREFAENAGVPFHLIRVSIGLEDIENLKAIFDKALNIL